MAQLFGAIVEARGRLAGQAHVTPVMTSRTLDGIVGAAVFLKCENFQRVGAFKFRGAFNALAQLSAEERRRGVITHSSGNHAQAVALAGALLGIRTTIVMPRDASPVKRAATAGYGGTIEDCEARDRAAVALHLQAERGHILIPPYDHPHVIAGQGTTALEFLSQVEHLDVLLAPCGGGGLLSGLAVAIKESGSRCRVIGVEPEAADDATRSFRSGTLVSVEDPQTIADGVRTPSLGTLTFPLVCRYVDEMVTVSEEAIRDAMRFLFDRLKIVVEPAGALGIAALLAERVRPAGRVGIILSGGNVDPAVAAAVFGGGD